MVGSKAAGASVTRISKLRGGGSSKVFSKAFCALGFIRSANKITAAFQPPS